MFENLIRDIGVEDVAALNIEIGGHPLLSKSRLAPDTPGNYGMGMHQIDDYYLITKIANKDKKNKIEYIAERLNKDIKVQM